TECDGHQSGSRRVRPGASSEIYDAIGRKGTDGQVVIAGPAEAAQVGATSYHFDEKPGPEFRVGRKDAGRGRVNGFSRFQSRLPHGSWTSILRTESQQRATACVARLVERRNVEPALRGQAIQEVAAAGGLKVGTFESRNEYLAFACCNHVSKRRKRFRVDESHSPADDNERMARSSLRCVSGNSRQAQQGQDVDVVPLERNRKSDHVEVACWRLRFERQKRSPCGKQFRQLLFRRKKNTLADDVVVGVQEAINRLKSQIRHSHPIRV